MSQANWVANYAIMSGELGRATVQIERVAGAEFGGEIGEHSEVNWDVYRCRIGPCHSAELSDDLGGCYSAISGDELAGNIGRWEVRQCRIWRCNGRRNRRCNYAELGGELGGGTKHYWEVERGKIDERAVPN
jgi:hypothetical protein